jgi:HPt (histidine-containing phosphotransfer) domain-containing protein
LAEERERCLASGMLDHVTKPIDEEILIEAILRYAGNPGTKGAAVSTTSDADPQPKEVAGPGGNDPVIDMFALHKRFQGREDFIRKLMDIAINSYQETPEKLRQAVQAGDIEQLQFIAHSLKGVSGNLEARVLNRLALQVESYAKQGHAQTGYRAIELASALEDVLTVLTQEGKAS